MCGRRYSFAVGVLLVGIASGGCSSKASSSAADAAPETSGARDSGQDAHPQVAKDGGHDASPPVDAGSDSHIEDAGTPDHATEASSHVDSGVTDAGVADGCAPGSSGEPPDLACTGLYSDWATKTVATNVHEYDPGLHLWSDGAVKTRWISLPAGQAINASDMDEWTFPVGTRLWKQFVVDGVLIETRFEWKMAEASWYLTTYRWSADLSSAPELTTGQTNVNAQGYEIPDQAACTECHGGRMDSVLGFEAVALSTPNATLAVTGTTPDAITLSQLVSAGWLSTAPTSAPTIPGSATASAALGYLHMNCGVSCHNSGNGMARSTGFLTRLDVANLATVAATDTVTTGVGKNSQFDIPGQATSYLLEPNSLAESSAYYRMSVRDGVDDAGLAAQMPPIVTHLVDDAGVADLAAWINTGCQ